MSNLQYQEGLQVRFLLDLPSVAPLVFEISVRRRAGFETLYEHLFRGASGYLWAALLVLDSIFSAFFSYQDPLE